MFKADFLAECEKIALQEKVKSLHLEEEACCKLQNRIQQLESDISETQVLLEKEKAKYHSSCHQQEVSATTNTRLGDVYGFTHGSVVQQYSNTGW